MWLDIRIRLCGWTKSLFVSRVGVCVVLSIRSLDSVVVGLPVLKRQSLGRGDPKLSLLCLWGQSTLVGSTYITIFRAVPYKKCVYCHSL